MALIDHTNFTISLKQSTNPRGSTPDGNVYFDTSNDKIQLIWRHQLAQIDFGAGLIDNPLVYADGITMRGLYNFENQQRRINETLRKFKRGTDGDYRFAGAFNFVNGVKLDSTDRGGIRNSGWIEYANIGDDQTAVDRIYHGIVSLNPIQSTTVPKVTLVTATDETTLQAATWSNFNRIGSINEAIQVFGSTANGDTGASNFDYTTHTAVVRVRSWGYNPGETTSIAAGITEFSGFSAGYGVGESINPVNIYSIEDVYGIAAISPWTGMSLEKLVIAQEENGFNETNGHFTWVLHNNLAGTVQQCAAYLDALSLQDTDIDIGAGGYIGNKGRVWYSRNASGKVVTASIGGAGLFIEGLSTSEQQNIIFTDDSNSTKTYPYFPEIRIYPGAAAISDPKAWYHALYVDGDAGADFDTNLATTVNDSAGNPIKGNVQADEVNGVITTPYAYDTNNQAGLSPGIDKQIVVLVEGDGIAGQAITYAVITRTPVISITCSPSADNNA